MRCSARLTILELNDNLLSDQGLEEGVEELRAKRVGVVRGEKMQRARALAAGMRASGGCAAHHDRQEVSPSRCSDTRVLLLEEDPRPRRSVTSHHSTRVVSVSRSYWAGKILFVLVRVHCTHTKNTKKCTRVDHPRILDADGPSGSPKIGELAAKTVPKP